MVYNCSVIGCLNNSVNQSDKRISYFPLPKEEDYCRKWLQLCPVIINYETLDKVRICSDHFDSTFRDWSLQQEMLGFTPEKLLINAVPTEKLPESRDLLKDEEVIINQWCNGTYMSHNSVSENIGYDPFTNVGTYASPAPQKINGTVENNLRMNDSRDLVQKPTTEHNKKKGRMTSKQIKILVEYMSNHIDFANNRVCGGAQGHKHKEKQWEHLARQLNEFGTIKSVDQWKKAWADLKRGARGRVENSKRMANGCSNNGGNVGMANGGGGNTSGGSVSEIDSIIVGIIGMEPSNITHLDHSNTAPNPTSPPTRNMSSMTSRPSTSYGTELGAYADVVIEEQDVDDYMVHNDMKNSIDHHDGVPYDLGNSGQSGNSNDGGRGSDSASGGGKVQPKSRLIKRKSTCQLLLEYQRKQTKIMEEMLNIMKKNEKTNERILTAVEIVANRFK